jgi:hypothetical protein
MKCIIKNMSPQTVGIFARINGADARFEIGPGKELIADNYETRIMKIYKKKGLILITPVNTAQLMESEASKLLTTEPVSTIEEVVNPNSDETTKQLDDIADIEHLQKNLTESLSVPKTFDEVKEEVEQYVEDGYIKGAWTEEDISFLKKYYPTKGRKHCSNSLNRNESSVQKKINSMGLKKKKKKK